MNHTEPGQPESISQIQLEAAVCDNQFAQAALGYYHEAVKAYEQGKDLEIYLGGITYYHNMGMVGGYDKGLDNEAVNVVLAGRGREEPNYNQRLGYAVDHENDRWLSGKITAAARTYQTT